MFSNMGFSKKLLIGVLSIVFLSMIISTFLITNKSVNSSQEMSKKGIEELSMLYSYKAEQNLDKSVVLTHTLASMVKSMYDKQESSKELIIDTLKNALEKNPYVLGLSVDLDSGNLFSNNSSLASSNGHDKDGRFAPYVYTSNGSIVVDGLTPENEEREWADVPRRTKKEHLTEPYYYNIDGKDVLMVTISSPIIGDDGKFLGATTVDLSLDSIAQDVSKIRVYENGYGFLITDKGVFVGHPKKEYLGKKIEETTNESSALQIPNKISNNTPYSFQEESDKNSIYSFYYVNPFKISNTGVSWGFGISVPEEEYLASANEIKWFSIIAGVLSILVISIVIIINIRVLNRNLHTITEGLKLFLII